MHESQINNTDQQKQVTSFLQLPEGVKRDIFNNYNVGYEAIVADKKAGKITDAEATIRLDSLITDLLSEEIKGGEKGKVLVEFFEGLDKYRKNKAEWGFEIFIDKTRTDYLLDKYENFKLGLLGANYAAENIGDPVNEMGALNQLWDEFDEALNLYLDRKEENPFTIGLSE